MSPSKAPVPTTATAPGVQQGDEVTVVIILPDGTEMVTVGTFDSADWNTDWQQVANPGKAYLEYEKGETTFDLHLRHVQSRRVSPEVAQGRRMLKP